MPKLIVGPRSSRAGLLLEIAADAAKRIDFFVARGLADPMTKNVTFIIITAQLENSFHVTTRSKVRGRRSITRTHIS